ncbi:MAG: hypothetical protein O3A46_12315, partial [Candidatus Poribacteria bacterium]|nr:hypothetical protein [Candidatus Poribacteria bacterium]
KGYARYVVDIPEADTYVIFGYVVAWDGNSDSFWVVVNPADGNENAQATGNTQFRWGVAQGAVWHWDQINHWLDGGTFEREWDLDKGEAEIIIYTREDATMLDALYMTNELPVVQGKLPTDQDVEKQMGNLPVAPKGKLATTWANLKR